MLAAAREGAVLTPDEIDWNPYSDRWRQDPYPKYRELRDHAPLHHAPESDAWTVSRYDDVVAVLKDTEVFSSKTRGGAPPSRNAYPPAVSPPMTCSTVPVI